MRDMIKVEREKIFSRKLVKFLFIMSIVLMAAYFFLLQFSYSSVFVIMIQEKWIRQVGLQRLNKEKKCQAFSKEI